MTRFPARTLFTTAIAGVFAASLSVVFAASQNGAAPAGAAKAAPYAAPYERRVFEGTRSNARASSASVASVVRGSEKK